MKTSTRINRNLLVPVLIILFSFSSDAKDKVAVLNADLQGIQLDNGQVVTLLRRELEKTNVYEIIDQYDLKDQLKKKNLDVSNCFGKQCLVETGKSIGADKVLTATIESVSEKILITLRLINVSTGELEKTQFNEFINVPKEIQTMMEISVKKLVGQQPDEFLVNQLEKEFSYESSVRNPGKKSLVLNGPRMGCALVTGETGRRMSDSREGGGFGILPFVSQFGYQHEIQYLNQGNFQALFEVVGMVSGIDQGMFIPSLTFMHGLRNNTNGWEFAFGPNFGMVRKADGYFDNRLNGDGKWHLEEDWSTNNGNEPNPNKIVERTDRRGMPRFTSAFVYAVGKTFKSGHLNIPVNIYVKPGKEGWYAGITFGFNTRTE